MSVGELYWECSCGWRRGVNPDEDLSQDRLCPQCRSLMTVVQEPPSVTDTDDTVRVELHDMAKLAQEGVDVSVSGEWDTTGLAGRKGQPEDD